MKDFTIDLESIEKKYQEERAKRLRKDGITQYRELNEDFTCFAADPHADPSLSRAPVIEDVDVVIVGGGFGGLLAGGRLREQGVSNLRIVEKGANFGGTWYWNRYPGAACDIESYIYLPLLEELGYMPTEKYAKAPEIYAHCQRVAQHYDLYRSALLQTGVTRAEWNETRKRWIVGTDRGDVLAARFLVSCTGLLTKPKLAAIPGIESFAGRSFHTSRWDYAYTGGDGRGALSGLADKVVGFIGTGATGVQAIPHLGASSKRLYVFQRTPSSIDPRGNRPTDPEWAKALQPGWQLERRTNFASILVGAKAPVDMVDDGWTAAMHNIAGRYGEAPPDPAVGEAMTMEQSRRRITEIVKDPATAEALKPYYHFFCKRPCFHDEYLETFNRPNVTLVDTQGKGVERITPAGVVVDGREYALDCLIHGTGFEWLTGHGRQFGIEIVGPGGVSLDQHWAEGPRTLYGLHTHGFPNFFLMQFIQAGGSVNYVYTADEQNKYIALTIAECLKRGVETVQPSKAAEDSWVAEVLMHGQQRRAFLESCTPGHYNFEGRSGEVAALNEFWHGGATEYNRRLEAWRAKADLEGLETT